jgi:hypothetical protein
MDFNQVDRVVGKLLLFFCEIRLTLNFKLTWSQMKSPSQVEFNNSDKKLNCFSYWKILL